MFLLEDKQGKNLHLEHLEDEIINFGVGGGRGAINFLRSLRDMLSGSSRTSVNLMDTTSEGWVRSKPLMKKDIREMVVPYINDAIEPLEREIASRLRNNFSH